jgi:hypothetical protein
MADVCLRLTVFIASPSDVAAERDIAEEEIDLLARECARRRLLLMPFRWETYRPTLNRPQTPLNDELRGAELTVAILWSRLGSVASVGGNQTGTEEELSVAGEQVHSGRSDDVFLYFKTADPPANAEADQVAKVRQFRSRLDAAKSVLYFEVSSSPDFRERFRADLRLWAERWYGVPEVCQFALEQSPPGTVPQAIKGENRFSRLNRLFPIESEPAISALLGRTAVDLYQNQGPDGFSQPLPSNVVSAAKPLRGRISSELAGPLENVATPLVTVKQQLYFAGPEWFSYFCAAGLVDAICQGRLDAVDRRPYVNAVHQYLKVLAVKNKAAIVNMLRCWLRNDENLTYGRPISRNFAAYVLGMLGALDAQDDLARAIGDDEGEDVQLYCITSLGKLRARRQLPVLVNLFSRTSDLRIRLMAAQAVCRMVGIARYEL